MAGLTRRWSRAAARERWAELAPVVERPLTLAMVGTGVWPLCIYLLHHELYRQPALVLSLLLGSVFVPVGLCLRGRRGIGPIASVVSVAGMTGASLLLGAQIIEAAPPAAYWMGGWNAAVVIVLVFARPVEELLVAMLLLVGANVVVNDVGPAQVQAWHVAPMTVGPPVPTIVCAIALAGALRASVRTARDLQAAAAAADERRAVAESLARQRRERLAGWERRVAPLLEEVAGGRVVDAALAVECAALARALRAELAQPRDSPFDVLLLHERAAMASRGGGLNVHDLGVGDDLAPADRVRLAGMVRELCDGAGFVTLTLSATSAHRALAVIDADGVALPDGPAWSSGTVTADAPARWWWDAELRRGQGDRSAVRWPSSTARR